jgi:hypothetical protein
MSSLTVETSSKSKRANNHRKATAQIPAVSRSKAKKPVSHQDQPQTSKQEQVLSLLRRSDGASIEEIMQTTDWQQHSVRGFLAGTVKKKLGLSLTSSKAAGDVRRYRIEAQRGR